MMPPLFFFLLLLGGKSTVLGCDSGSTSDSVPISRLNPNQFYKICPSQLAQGASLGQPICGDGTDFSFFFSKPVQRNANDKRLLIEFMGGGACWDAETCQKAGSFVSFPEQFNDFMGLSCSEISYAVQDSNGYPVSMLCARSIGQTDFTEYNTIVIPYCTQDVHTGDNTITYDDGTTMNHKGGHNTMGVLRWIFKNYPNPDQIAITGCSAGGTALPVAYDLIRNHYKGGMGRRTVQISTVMDSPVYLTPSYFLQSALGNWNSKTMLQQIIGNNFEKWRYSEEYPTKVFDSVLRRGSNKDQWGFVSHTQDPVSLAYYEWMSGNGGNDDDGQRRLENNGEYDQWLNETTAALQTIKNKHKNVADYFIEAEGHCSFGLYYALQDDGFESWAANIFQEQRVGVGPTTPRSVGLFLFSVAIGALLFAGGFYSSRNEKNEIQMDDGKGSALLEQGTNNTKKKTRFIRSVKNAFRQFLTSVISWSGPVSSFPITAAYAVATTLYFWAMIISKGFAHPLNNPSLGPSAIGLSDFGINNPSLIVYYGQIFRLVTSAMLCSGITTYLIVLLCLWCFTKPLEQMIHNSIHFGVICLIIILGSNLCYALAAEGASCSSVALVLGLNTVCIILRRKMGNLLIRRISIVTIFFLFLASAVFPFNNWRMLLAAILFGMLIGLFVARVVKRDIRELGDGLHTTNAQDGGTIHIQRKGLLLVGGVLAVLFVCVIFRVNAPDRLYLQPYYTGCDLMYAEGEDVSSVAQNYMNNDNDDGRLLRQLDDGYDSICAQFCIPHIAAEGAVYGSDRVVGLPVTRGKCEDLGYDEHMADKTFEYFSYSLDVEIFTTAQTDDNN
jgi:membrane associated rhomboid family serine protease